MLIVFHNHCRLQKCQMFFFKKKHETWLRYIFYTCTVMKSDLPVPNHTQSHQLPFQECWSICVIHKLPDTTPTTSATNMKRCINWFWNPANSQVSTSDNLTGPPPPLLPVLPLAAPANTGQSSSTADEGPSAGWKLHVINLSSSSSWVSCDVYGQ